MPSLNGRERKREVHKREANGICSLHEPDSPVEGIEPVATVGEQPSAEPAEGDGEGSDEPVADDSAAGEP